MDSILDYFISLQESQPAELPERAIERWNKRADFWEDARKKKEKGDERVISAINYLDSKGLLEKNYDVADIGCGPGRFAAAFAKYVHKVVGLDISDKMVKHGMEHIQNEGLNNAILYTCNFQTLDIDKSGYTHAFDLVLQHHALLISIDFISPSILWIAGVMELNTKSNACLYLDLSISNV